MKKILNKKVVKYTVKDLKEALKDAPDESDVVLGFYMKDGSGVHFCYLANVYTDMKYDSVVKDKLYDSTLVELAGFDHQYSTYVEKTDD